MALGRNYLANLFLYDYANRKKSVEAELRCVDGIDIKVDHAQSPIRPLVQIESGVK